MTEQTDRDRIVAALYDSRRHGLGGMTEAQAVGHMADAVLAALAPAVPAGQAPATDRAAPPFWIDGHPQLEAIAAAVWERCRTEDTSLVVDDPRNIAVAALAALHASVARADEEHRLALSDALGLGTGAPWDAIHERATELGLPPLGQDPVARRLGLVAEHRATVLREEAARIRAHCPDHLDADSAEGSWMVCHCDVADDIERRLAAVSAVVVRRATDETQGEAQPAPAAIRAAVLDEAAGIAEDVALKRHRQHEIEREQGALDVMTVLRRAAGEARFVAEHQRELVHGCPPDGSGLTPCCGRTPLELPLTDRISSEAPVTCPGPVVGAQQPKEA